MKKKKYIPLLILPALLLTIAGIVLFYHKDSFRFYRLSETFFRESLESDALTLHYTLADPEKYGIACTDPALPVYSPQTSARSEDSIKAFLTRLETINPQNLSRTEQNTYELLSSYLKSELEGNSFSFYEEPLSPSCGMHTELLLLLAEYPFRSQKDVQNYLSLLRSVPSYLEGLALYETQKAQAGLFMAKKEALDTASQCQVLWSSAQLSQNSHFLQTTFQNRLSTLLADGKVTQAQYEQFLKENDQLLTAAVAPAYSQLADTMTALSAQAAAPGGLCQLPDGKAYYAWKVKQMTGCSLSLDELYLLLQKQFQKTISQLRTCTRTYRQKTGSLPDPDTLQADFPLSDPDQILSDLQYRMSADFPQLSALTEEKILCSVRNVDEALTAFTSPAYYMTPPIDDLYHNTIRVNPKSTAEGLELYTTLAHEGYPGHLYQTVYSALSAEQTKQPPVRELLYYGGYIEGWAYYAERLSYSYAAQLLEEHNILQAALLCEIAALQKDLLINLYCLLDIQLHYQGVSRAEILQKLTGMGITEENGAQIYDYLRTAPGIYLKYYVGYLEMLALRAKAQEVWGDDFSLPDFHRFVLECGPSDFSGLIRQLKAP